MKVKVLNIIDNNTFKATVALYRQHPKYKKYITSYTNYLVHYDSVVNKISVGQEVVISPSRPISKRKRWILK